MKKERGLEASRNEVIMIISLPKRDEVIVWWISDKERFICFMHLSQYFSALCPPNLVSKGYQGFFPWG
jgi:hypothetical protein